MNINSYNTEMKDYIKYIAGWEKVGGYYNNITTFYVSFLLQ